MLEKISWDVKHEALTLLEKGNNQLQAAEILGISDRTIPHARSRARNHGDIEGGKKKPGQKVKLTPEMKEVNCHYLIDCQIRKLLVKMVFYKPIAILSEYTNEFNKPYPEVQLNTKYLN
jgi:hypothetical protein